MEKRKRETKGTTGTNLEQVNAAQQNELLSVLSDWAGNLKVLRESDASKSSELNESKRSQKQGHDAYVSQRSTVSSKIFLPSIKEKKTNNGASSTLQPMIASVYTQNLAGPSKPTKVSTVLLKIGTALQENPSIMTMFDISTRGRVDDLLGPMQLQSTLSSLLGIRLSSQEIGLLMSRFGSAGVNSDKIDVVEVLSWARSSYEKNHQELNYKMQTEKTKKEVQRLMRRNHVMNKTEKKRAMQEELHKKLDLKLSLAAFNLINGNDKISNILEKTESAIEVETFKSLLPKMDLFLSKLEQNCLVSEYLVGPGEIDSKFINFEKFRKIMFQMAQDAIRAARQEKAVADFKSALAQGTNADSVSTSSSIEILEMISAFREVVDDNSDADIEFFQQELNDNTSNAFDSTHKYASSITVSQDIEILSDDNMSLNANSLYHDGKHVSFSKTDIAGPQNRLPNLSNSKERLNNSLSKPSVDSVVNWMADPLGGEIGSPLKSKLRSMKSIDGKQIRLTPIDIDNS